MVNEVNHLIEALSTTKGIIHLIDKINKSITIINKNTTFGDIINICDLAIKQIKKNDIDSINVRLSGKKILITIINNILCKYILPFYFIFFNYNYFTYFIF